MEIHLLDLPNELLELILLNIIARPWKNDVRDFLAFTSTCRILYRFAKLERYWKIMTRRRDPDNSQRSEKMTELEYCQQVYLMRTIRGDELVDCISRYDKNYYCKIEKVTLWPHRIRVYIDERGNNSRGGLTCFSLWTGSIQHPSDSILAAVDTWPLFPYGRFKGDTVINSHFSIEDHTRQYLGYLDFLFKLSFASNPISIVFQYGMTGYSNAVLFHIDQTFIDKYNIYPLLKHSSTTTATTTDM